MRAFKNGFLKRFLRQQRTRYYLFGTGQLGRLTLKLLSSPHYFEFIKKIRPEFEWKILDVGCGHGKLLFDMLKDGFHNLTGIDPFIDKDIFYERSLKILGKEIYEIDGEFDLIILNHSFEHMPKPAKVLRKIYDLLSPGKFLLIRTPIANSFAWRTYGVNWVQLDAPRHFFVHTVKSLKILAKKAEFRMTDIVFDSTEFQFWGSEQYQNNIPLRSSRSYAENPGPSIFTAEQIASYRQKAAELNKKEDGDSASFYLQRPE